jgi:hypothetical protein
VLLGLGAQFLELRTAVVLVFDEALGEGTGLDVGEDSLHVFLHLGGDDARAGDVVAVLSGVGNAPALLGDAALPHEVNDELELVQYLEVGDLRLVAGFGQGFEAVLDQLGHAAAEDGLLAEEVGFGLFGEGGLDDAGAGAADGLGVGLGEVPGGAGSVLLDGDDVRDAAAGFELAANGVAGCLRGDQDDVNALRCLM